MIAFVYVITNVKTVNGVTHDNAVTVHQSHSLTVYTDSNSAFGFYLRCFTAIPYMFISKCFFFHFLEMKIEIDYELFENF